MKFAVVEGERRGAEPSLSGKCPGCSKVVIAKCGKVRIWHWAHQGTAACDRWWEPETEWHRAWKNHFPQAWQEMIHTSKEGGKHITDVKTDGGVVLEFQHSLLRRDERESREIFYQNMVWVVDGRRRSRDRAQFFASFDSAKVFTREPLIVSVQSNESALLRDWEACRAPVYFDFGNSEPGDALWRLSPRSASGRAYISKVSKTSFLQAHRTGQPFDKIFDEVVERAAADFLMRTRQAARSGPLMGFGLYMARRQRARRRF